MYISELSSNMPKEFNSDLEERIFKKLEELNIPFEVIDNDPADSMEECIEIDKKLGAEIRKTVVVCNRQKTQYSLIVMPADKRFETKVFAAKMECARVSFASSDDLFEKLGVVPGSATVLAVINDKDNLVQVVIDKEVADNEYFACNVSDSRRHIKIKTKDLLEIILPNLDHEAKIVEL